MSGDTGTRDAQRALHAEIKAAGYSGVYSWGADFVRSRRPVDGQAVSITAYVPLKFELGEAFQFDWSEEGLVVGGMHFRVQVAHLKPCTSQTFSLVAYALRRISSRTFGGKACKLSIPCDLRV